MARNLVICCDGTNNQFGPGAMVTIKERKLCVPVVENP